MQLLLRLRRLALCTDERWTVLSGDCLLFRLLRVRTVRALCTHRAGENRFRHLHRLKAYLALGPALDLLPMLAVGLVVFQRELHTGVVACLRIALHLARWLHRPPELLARTLYRSDLATGDFIMRSRRNARFRSGSQ